MQSVTSCFNRAVIRSDWRRFWPLALLYAAIWWFILPVQLLNRIQYLNQFAEDAIVSRLSNSVYEVLPAAAVVPMIFCCLLAMALYSYMMKGSSVGLMHSLPVNRAALYLSHFAAGMEMLTAGNVLTFMLSVLVASTAPGSVPWTPLLLCLLASEVCCIFFFVFAVFSAMLTGWLLLVPVVYVGLNFAVMAVISLLEALKGLFYFGYTGEAYAPWVNWLTPVINLKSKLTAVYQNIYDEWLYLPKENLRALALYGIAALILLWLGFVLYKHRRSESAGDPVAYGWLRPIARQVIGVVGGLGFGFAIYAMTDWGGTSILRLMLCQMLAGIICCVAMEMLMRKSFRVLDRKGIIGVIVAVALIGLVCLGLKMDVGGYQSRIPDAEQVESVEISGTFTRTWYNYSDKETIAAAVALHEAIVEAYREDPSVGEWKADENDQYIRLYYYFADGTQLSRAYDLSVTPGSGLHQALNALCNTEEMRYHSIFDFGESGRSYQFQGGYADCWSTGGSIQLTAEQANELYAVLLEEIESADKVDVLESGGCYGCDIQLDTQKTQETVYLYDLPCQYEKAAQLLVDWGLADSIDMLKADCDYAAAADQGVYDGELTSF